MLRLVLNHWSIKDSLQHMSGRSSNEDIHSLVLGKVFSAAVFLPLPGKTVPSAHWRPLPTTAAGLFGVSSPRILGRL